MSTWYVAAYIEVQCSVYIHCTCQCFCDYLQPAGCRLPDVYLVAGHFKMYVLVYMSIVRGSRWVAVGTEVGTVPYVPRAYGQRRNGTTAYGNRRSPWASGYVGRYVLAYS